MGSRAVKSRQLLYQLYHLLWQSLDLLLPPTCGGCGAPGQRWCPDCRRQVPRLRAPFCETCGTPVSSTRRQCAGCLAKPPSFRKLRSWSAFDVPIRPALHRLKYRRDLGLSEALVPQLAAYAAGLCWSVDLIIPVPLGSGRRKERGYNQAGLISWPLSLALGISHSPRAIFRSRETRSQVGLSRAERQENVRDAFSALPALVKDRRILMVDDVATTGATLSSCAEALYAAGARDVLGLTVARAIRGSSGDA